MSSGGYSIPAKTTLLLAIVMPTRFGSALIRNLRWVKSRQPCRSQKPSEYLWKWGLCTERIKTAGNTKADSDITWSLMTPLSHNQPGWSLQESEIFTCVGFPVTCSWKHPNWCAIVIILFLDVPQFYMKLY